MKVKSGGKESVWLPNSLHDLTEVTRTGRGMTKLVFLSLRNHGTAGEYEWVILKKEVTAESKS
jgi:hypothetical protein